MGFDVAAAERLAMEVSRVFADSLQSMVSEAAKEAEQVKQRLDDEARALAKGKARLEDAWRQLSVEKHRLEMAKGAAISLECCQSAAPAAPGTAPGVIRFDTPPRGRAEGGAVAEEVPKGGLRPALAAATEALTAATAAPLELRAPLAGAVSSKDQETELAGWGGAVSSKDLKVELAGWGKVQLSSQADDPWNFVPADCQVTIKDYTYSVLPVQTPDACSMGHDLWNHTVEVPEGWEVLSSEGGDFADIIASLTKHRWGAIVLGVKGAELRFDAYWTPLFGDGAHAGQLCQEDVDWIEPVEGGSERFRMTYSGLRLVMRRPAAAAVARAQPRKGRGASANRFT